MPVLVDRLKELWHSDLVADPVIHGWVLNLYREGERHPQTVRDYFPSSDAPDPALAEDLRRHEADEARHERMYAAAIRALGEPVQDLGSENVFNWVIRSFTPVSFAIEPDDPEDVRRTKLAHFLAHAHHLEKRVARSLLYHLDACEKAGNRRVAGVVAAVLRDEDRHVRYTRESVFALLPRDRARETLAIHRQAEARANLAFSARQVQTYLRRFPNAPRRRLYRFCAWVMQEGVRGV
jgi:hypothetical protein